MLKYDAYKAYLSKMYNIPMEDFNETMALSLEDLNGISEEAPESTEDTGESEPERTVEQIDEVVQKDELTGNMKRSLTKTLTSNRNAGKTAAGASGAQSKGKRKASGFKPKTTSPESAYEQKLKKNAQSETGSDSKRRKSVAQKRRAKRSPAP